MKKYLIFRYDGHNKWGLFGQADTSGDALSLYQDALSTSNGAEVLLVEHLPVTLSIKQG